MTANEPTTLQQQQDCDAAVLLIDLLEPQNWHETSHRFWETITLDDCELTITVDRGFVACVAILPGDDELDLDVVESMLVRTSCHPKRIRRTIVAWVGMEL